jgi:AcrR family transcriptional regulator
MSEETAVRGERTSAEIVQAAHHLFLTHGFHGTSMRQIAAGAGIALGSIYNHFPSKEDIFIAVVLQYHPLFDVLPAMNAARGDTIEALIRDAAARMVAGMDDRFDFLNIVFIELVEFKGCHLPRILQKLFPELMQFAQRIGDTNAELRPIPPPVVARAFLGLFFSFVMTELIIANQLPAVQENAFDHFVEIFLHGILAEKPAAWESAG